MEGVIPKIRVVCTMAMQHKKHLASSKKCGRPVLMKKRMRRYKIGGVAGSRKEFRLEVQ